MITARRAQLKCVCAGGGDSIVDYHTSGMLGVRVGVRVRAREGKTQKATPAR